MSGNIAILHCHRQTLDIPVFYIRIDSAEPAALPRPRRAPGVHAPPPGARVRLGLGDGGAIAVRRSSAHCNVSLMPLILNAFIVWLVGNNWLSLPIFRSRQARPARLQKMFCSSFSHETDWGWANNRISIESCSIIVCWLDLSAKWIFVKLLTCF